jgi:hypothetical protein
VRALGSLAPRLGALLLRSAEQLEVAYTGASAAGMLDFLAGRDWAVALCVSYAVSGSAIRQTTVSITIQSPLIQITTVKRINAQRPVRQCRVQDRRPGFRAPAVSACVSRLGGWRAPRVRKQKQARIAAWRPADHGDQGRMLPGPLNCVYCTPCHCNSQVALSGPGIVGSTP